MRASTQILMAPAISISNVRLNRVDVSTRSDDEPSPRLQMVGGTEPHSNVNKSKLVTTANYK